MAPAGKPSVIELLIKWTPLLASGFLWGGQPARQLTALDKRKKALVLETIITYCDYAAELKRAQVEAAASRRVA